MDSVKLFIMGLLFITVVVFIIAVIGASMRDTVETVSAAISGNATNETGINASHTGDYLSVYGLRGLSGISVSACYNVSHSTDPIPTSEYTYSTSTGFINKTVKAGSGNIWNCTYTYTYKDGQAEGMLNNITTGTTSFFTNASTWFSLLSVVIIILIIAIVIMAVNRFGGGGQTPEGL